TALDKVAELQKAARWKEAEAVLDGASERLGDSGPAELLERIRQTQDDLALVARLDAIRQSRIIWVGNAIEHRTAEVGYEAAFRGAGLGPDTKDVEAVAARISTSNIRDQLLATLDDWAEESTDSKRAAWLVEVARRAEPDSWRNRLRDASLRRDRSALETLA